jgi:hypothetical protein
MTDETNGGGKAGLLTVRQLVNEARAADAVDTRKKPKTGTFDAVISILAKKGYRAGMIEKWLAARGHKISVWLVRSAMKRNKKRYAEVEAELAAVATAPTEPDAAEPTCACKDGACKQDADTSSVGEPSKDYSLAAKIAAQEIKP